MARIKHTKTELKTQREHLRRFERYLPTLQLKKQQLQTEVRHLEIRIEKKELEEREARTELAAWIRLFAEPADFDAWIRLEDVRLSEGNIAGVTIPVLEDVRLARTVPDLFATPPWVDNGIAMIEKLLRLRIERRVLDEQRKLLRDELRVTTQRVNLFEKVKIPGSRENIRVIRVFLGDQQTAEVARAKIAKGRSVEKVRSA